MLLTNVLFKKAKTKNILVEVVSLASGHRFLWMRERLADKLELIRLDPFIGREAVYRETRRVQGPRKGAHN